MRVELHEANDAVALGGTPELWMRVLSDQLLDLPTVVKALDPDQGEVFAGYQPKPSRFIPGGPYDEDGPDHDFAFEDWWVFRKRNED